jgi:uncharacterized protein
MDDINTAPNIRDTPRRLILTEDKNLPAMKKILAILVAIIVTCILVVTLLLTLAPSGAATCPGPVSPPIPGLLSTVPDVRQSEPYSCGAACLQAVFSYRGIDMREGVLMQELNTSENSGTPPEALVRVAREHGLFADMRTNLTLADLELALSEKVPIIIACQAWRDQTTRNLSWENDWEDGHYMVVIGMDSHNVYFEDPSMLGTRGMIPRDEFVSRWHDYQGDPPFDKNASILNHMGIFIRETPPAQYPAFVYVE